MVSTSPGTNRAIHLQPGGLLNRCRNSKTSWTSNRKLTRASSQKTGKREGWRRCSRRGNSIRGELAENELTFIAGLIIFFLSGNHRSNNNKQIHSRLLET
jgi:hypothetical protein